MFRLIPANVDDAIYLRVTDTDEEVRILSSDNEILASFSKINDKPTLRIWAHDLRDRGIAFVVYDRGRKPIDF